MTAAKIIPMTKAEASGKPVYAPIPARAITDDRLAGRHLRTLAVIAAHDRLNANGVGCWAGHDRLATMIGCDYTRLSANIADLIELGYIERVAHPQNRRLRVYRVVYNIADAATMKGVPDRQPRTGKPSTPDSLPTGKVEEPDSLPNVSGSTNEIKHIASTIYSPEGVENTFRRSERIHSAEAAPISIGGQLAEWDRRLRRRRLSPHEVPIWLEKLQSIIDSTEHGDPVHHQAQRLFDELSVADGRPTRPLTQAERFAVSFARACERRPWGRAT